MTKVKGFCYVTHKPVELTHAEWRARMAGNRRRCDHGETYIHEAGGPRILAEIYANVSAPRAEAA